MALELVPEIEDAVLSVFRDGDKIVSQLSVVAVLPSTGWRNAVLADVRYISPPIDGIQDVEVLADSPEPGGIYLPWIHKVLLQQRFTPSSWIKGYRLIYGGQGEKKKVITLSEAEAKPAFLFRDGGGDGGGDIVWPWGLLQARLKAGIPSDDLSVGLGIKDRPVLLRDLVGLECRIIRPGDFVTMDYRLNRANISLDKDGRIAQIDFY
ncbi:I78 family peptidase inhibitor [Paraburkholderia phytofirmans]|uniref:I78 family peptidase inhibitor n=1 Tax=Paraburkholderia phytofirmans TaxID=261302 RepID=UPI0038BB2C3D